MQKRKLAVLIALPLLVSGCGDTQKLGQFSKENQALKTQVAQLQKQNEALQNRLTKYEPTQEKSSVQPNATVSETERAPVELASISVSRRIATFIDVTFTNTTPKTVDAIEFVVLQFDNFGRPAYRFNDKKEGNVTGDLLLQGTAVPGATLNGAWKIFNADAVEKCKVILKQVHFTDRAV